MRDIPEVRCIRSMGRPGGSNAQEAEFANSRFRIRVYLRDAAHLCHSVSEACCMWLHQTVSSHYAAKIGARVVHHARAITFLLA